MPLRRPLVTLLLSVGHYRSDYGRAAGMHGDIGKVALLNLLLDTFFFRAGKRRLFCGGDSAENFLNKFIILKFNCFCRGGRDRLECAA